MVTVTILVVQTAIGQFSARYLRISYRDGLLKSVLAVLLGTLTFSFALLRHVSPDFVPNIGVTFAGYFLIVGLLLFLLFLDRVLHRLRPVAVAALVARQGRQDFFETTPAATDDVAEDEIIPAVAPSLSVVTPRAGAIQALHVSGLIRWARENDCVLVVRYAVGDFVLDDGRLIDVYGTPGADAERKLKGMVAFGEERTVLQDPAFAIRVMVDIAIRALSPAVNDPTTAVQVINHLAPLLRVIGMTDLRGSGIRRDEHGAVRLVLRSRRWEDYLMLGVAEIRQHSGNSLQVVRRLHAMLDDLRVSVRPEHLAAVDDELARLAHAVQSEFADSADLDRACEPDRQGVGGPTGSGTAALTPAGR